MIENFGKMGVNQSLKIHFLANHLDFFPENLGDTSDEHGERFHQDIAFMEARYNGKDHCRMLQEYLWSLCREGSNYKREAGRQHF